MCASCIDFKDPDAPDVAALIIQIRRKLRRQRTAKWGLRALAVLLAGLVFLQASITGEVPLAWLFVACYLYLAWIVLVKAAQAAEKVDHTRLHLRRTLALKGAAGREDEPG